MVEIENNLLRFIKSVNVYFFWFKNYIFKNIFYRDIYTCNYMIVYNCI